MITLATTKTGALKALNQNKPVTSLSSAERRTRLVLDMLRFNAEAAQAAYLRLSQLLEAVYDRKRTDVGRLDVSGSELSAMFSDAWTVVRACHSIFEIIRKEKLLQLSIPATDIALGSLITKVRNRMDHLSNNIGNFSNYTVKPMPPLLGFLTACFVPKCEDGSPVEVLDAIVLSHRDFNHAVDIKAFPDDEQMFPFSGWMAHLRLHAFEHIVELSMASNFVVRLLSAMDSADSRPKQERFNLIISMRGQAPFDVSFK